MMHYPKISIITPSYQQGHFIEETILSVIGQGYPNLEYIVMDGGSTDNTVAIIEKYQAHIHYWESVPDEGQAHAINKGLQRATGDIIAWLNSDDVYLPGILYYIAQTMNIAQAEILAGNCVRFREGESYAVGCDTPRYFTEIPLSIADTLTQPATFFTKKAIEQVGQIRQELCYALDWEWYLRAQKMGVYFRLTTKYCSMYRLHAAHKSGDSKGSDRRAKELAQVYEEYAGKKTADFYLYCYRNADKIRRSAYILTRLKLSRFLSWLMPLMHPTIRPFGWKYTQEFLKMT